MPYTVKEIFYTLQGEGENAGRPAVFCRFTGCNLWSGREADRRTAICTFCDTDFVGFDGEGGGRFSTAEGLANAIASKWPRTDSGRRFVVCTGGEPLLQVDQELIEVLHRKNFWIAVETNGTIPIPEGVDWSCVSPKSGSELVVTHGNELKVVFPQEIDPRSYAHLKFDHFFVQPKDGDDAHNALFAATQFCLENPQWRLSLQIHKIIGIR